MTPCLHVSVSLRRPGPSESGVPIGSLDDHVEHVRTREVIAFCLFPAVLLLAAWMIRAFGLWSRTENVSAPWFLSVVAVAVLLVGVVSLLPGQAPGNASDTGASPVR